MGRRGPLVTLSGLLTAWLAFRAGGFFPGQVGLVGLTLCLALVVRITVASRPFAGWSPALALASGALALLAIWTLASAAWSDAPGRALTEFDRTLLYALVLVLTGSAVARVGDLTVLLRWTAAAFVAITLAGLLTRLAPGTFPIGAGFLPERISFPLTYWNAMGIACALCVLFACTSARAGKSRAGCASSRRRCCRWPGDALPDVLARGDLGAADRARALRGCAQAARAAHRGGRRGPGGHRASGSPTARNCWRVRTTTPQPRHLKRVAWG